VKRATRGGGQAGFAGVTDSRYWREQDARMVLDEWSSSGLGLEDFARRHKLRARRLRRWLERLGPGRARAGRFHPVELRLDGLRTREAESDDGGVTVVVRGGRRIAVGRDFDEELLTRVVRVVESWAC
jgi:hypothetical protein